MAKKTAKRVKHVPQRTCIGCRQTLAKRAMLRIVRTPEGLRVDPTGKLPGRGAYLHENRACWERALKGALAHALKVEFTDQDREMLRGFMAALPDEALLPDGPLPEEALSDEPLAQEDSLPSEEALPVQGPSSSPLAEAEHPTKPGTDPDREPTGTLKNGR